MGRNRDKLKLDRYYYNEALDRSYIVANIIEDLLVEHPVIMKHEELRDKIKSAHDNVLAVYQLIGGLDMELFPDGSDKQ